MALEAACTSGADPVVLALLQGKDGLWLSDWQPLIERLCEPGEGVVQRADVFHASLAQAILDQALAVRAQFGVERLGLAGGVFQNRVLCELVVRLAKANGFELALPLKLPANDAALSFGQLVESAAP